MTARIDHLLLILTVLFLGGPTVVAGAIFAPIYLTGRAVCHVGRLCFVAGIDLNHTERG